MILHNLKKLSEAVRPGKVAARSGDFRAELKRVRLAHRFGDRRPFVENRLAELLLQWEHFDEARQIRLKQCQRRRSWKAGMLGLYEIHWARTEYEQALAVLAELDQGTGGRDFEVRLLRAKALGLEGQSAAAEKAFEDLTKDFREREMAIGRARAQVLQFEQRRDEAAALLRELAAKPGGRAVGAMLLQNRLMQFRHEPTAALAEELRLGIDKGDVGPGFRAQVLIKLGDLAGFRALFRSLEGSPRALPRWPFAAFDHHLAGRVEEARQVWQEYVRKNPVSPVLPPAPDELQRLDAHPLPERADEYRLYTVIRNEKWRLAWFCDYYRSIGVDRFFFVDNGSTDGSREWLLSQPDVHVFHTEASFAASDSGVKWVNFLTNRYGQTGWTLYLDVDEAFVFHGIEWMGLRGLTRLMDERGDDLVRAFMLDMFADAPQALRADGFERDFVAHYPLFDSGIDFMPSPFCPYFHTSGGARRVFGHQEIITKTPLVRGGRGIQFLMSSHKVSPGQVCEVIGANLHFKLVGDFAAEIRLDLANNQRIAYCRNRYSNYLQQLNDGPLTFQNERTMRYESSDTLVKAGLISGSLEAAMRACDFHLLETILEDQIQAMASTPAAKWLTPERFNPLLLSIQYLPERERTQARLRQLRQVVEARFEAGSPDWQIAVCRLTFALGDRNAFRKAFSGLSAERVPKWYYAPFATTASKWTDNLQPDWTEEKVFVIGLSKTGTTSMHAALKLLGYHAVHWRNQVSFALLSDEDFAVYDAFTDIPIAARFEELDAKFPNAKFIYTTRPVSSWVNSIRRHYDKDLGIQDPAGLKAHGPRSRFSGKAAGMEASLYAAHETWEDAQAFYHNRVTSHFAQRGASKCLHFSLFDGDGWPELCAFLGKPTPNRPFPHANASEKMTS